MHPEICFSKWQTVGTTILAFFLITGNWHSPASAQSDTASNVLQFRGSDDFSPYEFINAKNQPDGYNVDLTKAIVRKMGLKVNIVLAEWFQVRQDLETGKIDALMGQLYSEERAKRVDFSIPHVVISFAVFVRENTDFRDLAELRGKEIIVIKRGYVHDWLLTHNDFIPGAKVIAVARFEEALQLLSGGQHDCAVIPRLHGLDVMRSLKIDNLKTIGPPLLTQKMSFTVGEDNEDLLAKINEGLYLVQTSGEYDQIYRKWFSVYEQKRFLDRLLQVGKLVGFPLLAVFGLGALWIRSLKKMVARRTQSLEENRRLLDRIVQGTPLPTLVTDRDGNLILWNRACEKLTRITADAATNRLREVTRKGESADPLLLQLIASEMPTDSNGNRFKAHPHFLKNSPEATELEVCLPQLGDDGCWLYGSLVSFCDEQANPLGTIETWQDLTNHKNLEKQLAGAQRMEAMGRLAGGIAHDFTNFLQAILTLTEAARLDIPTNSPARHRLDDIEATVNRARELVYQIMIFSRHNLLKPKPVQLKAVVEKSVAALKPNLPASVNQCLSFESDIQIMADEVSIARVVTNLCMNAINAMLDAGGTLTVALNAVEVSREMAMHHPELRLGPYAKLSVADTGKGIPDEHLSRIFEPFFTTRKTQGGTGMGLAITHGIVKGYDGVITVESEVGKGTVFMIFWPAIHPVAVATRPSVRTEIGPRQPIKKTNRTI
jgi:two-component system sensor histidine kinase EvgS